MRRLSPLALCVLAACAHSARVTPARAACPAPRVDTRDWTIFQDTAGVSLRLPPGFASRPSPTPTRQWALDGDFQQYVITGFIASSAPVPAMGRVPAAGMREMTQCVDSVNGREVLIQAWRTVGGTFRNFQRQDRYDVFAVVAVDPLRRFYITSGGYEQRVQDLALAMVRTIAIGPSPPRP